MRAVRPGRDRLWCAGAVGPRRLGRSLVDERDESQDPRHDLLAEAGAVEHAVMADLQLQMMQLLPVRDVGAQLMGGIGLADPRNIVLLALDREQPAIADRGRIDWGAAMRHFAL